MLYDRPYMQSGYQPPSGKSGWQVDRVIIGVTVAIFIIQAISAIWFAPASPTQRGFMERYFALYPQGIQEGLVWSFFTYGFLHSTQNLFHILLNMLIFYFFAQPLLQRMGDKLFLILYFGGILLGGIGWILFNFDSTRPLVGASAGVFGLVICFICLNPRQPLYLFPFPFPIKPVVLAYILVGINGFGFIFYELPGTGNVAFSAHLAGALYGYLFYRVLFKSGGLFQKSDRNVEKPSWWKKKDKVEKTTRNFTINLSSRKKTQEEVDRILDKINEHGFGSLTEDEKKTLDRARDLGKK